ncbi:SseB family protein [Actinoplanes ianthinogenes]|uniref:SseB family protein n=1 Tax=Actinoplanes ianthinogenes TaxID=122358 RepID=UPI00279547F4|nr:SseB family protein [Actinoplanes ianthinogenes]
MSEWEPATDAEVAMRDALRTDDQESYFRILAGVDLLLPVSADALAGLAPLGWGTWSTGGRTHVLAFTSQEALHACLSDYTGASRRVPYSELANTWPNLEWWLAVNPGLPIEGYLPAWFVAQLARGDLRLPTRGPGREVHGTSKIQEIGAAALAAKRAGDGPGGPTYETSAPAAAASGYPAYSAGSPEAPAGPIGAPGVPGAPASAPSVPGGGPQPSQPGLAPSGLPQRGVPQPGAAPSGPAGAPQFGPGGAPVSGGAPQFGPGGAPLSSPASPAVPGAGPAGQPSGLPVRAAGLPARPTTPSGLPVRTPSGVDPADQPPAASVPAAYKAPAVPRDFPGSPAAPAGPRDLPGAPGGPTPRNFPGSPVSSGAPSGPGGLPVRGTSGSGMATPGWNSESVPFGPENDPRGPLQDPKAPLPVRNPGANTPPIPEHVTPYDPTEAQVDPSWAALGSGRAPSPASGAGPLPSRGGADLSSGAGPLPTRGGADLSSGAGSLPSRGDLSSGAGLLPTRGADLPSGAGPLPTRGGAELSSGAGPLPSRGGSDLPRRQPGQTAGPAQTTSFSGFTNPRTNPAPAAPAPSFPQGPASPQAAAAQAPAPGAPAQPGGQANALPRRQVTPPSERPPSMAAAAQALTGGHTPAPDPALAQRDAAADRFGPSGPAPALSRDSGPAGDRSTPPSRPGLLPPVIPGASGADRGAQGYGSAPGYGASASGFGASGPGTPGSGSALSGTPGYGSTPSYAPGFGGPSAHPVSGAAAPGSPASGHGAPGQFASGLGAPGQPVSGPGVSGHAVSGPGAPGQPVSGSGAPGQPVSGSGAPGHPVPGPGAPGQPVSGASAPGHPVSGAPGQQVSGAPGQQVSGALGQPVSGAAAPGSPISGAGAPGAVAEAPASGSPVSAYPASGSPAATSGAPGYAAPSGYGPSAYAPATPGYAVPAVPAPGATFGMPPQGSPASAYASQAFATQIIPTAKVAAATAPTSGTSGLGVAGSATGGASGSEGQDHRDFVPANDTERELQDAADAGNTDVFLSTLLLANVLVPVAHHSRPGSAPGESGFAFQPEEVDGEKFLIVFTSKDRLSEHFGEPTRTVGVRFYELIRNWPDPNWSFAVNPGTPVGAKYPGTQIIALANWATEAGLGADPIEGPAAEEAGAPVPAPDPVSDEAQHATVMQKTIAAEQVDYYLDRGYDRVAGFVHRASEVEHLRTPAELFGALGLYYDASPFQPDAKEAFVLRWPAFRPSLYRIPYGGQNEQALRAMDGWVIERPPFRGNGFAPGEGRDVIAEFKVDSVRLPHGAQLWRIDADGNERMLAIFDADGPLWRRVGEQ